MKQKLALILAPIFIPLLALQAQSNYGTPYAFTTLAGLASGAGSTDGMGGSARFNQPGGLAVDGSGNIYVADTNNHTVRKITAAGAVTTFAGTAGSHGSTDSTGGAPLFYSPNGATVDGSGNVYVADTSNNTIRKIAPGGAVTTLAGTAGVHGSTNSADGAPLFNSPFAVAADGAGNVYVADTYNNSIRKITAAGVVTTLAGAGNNVTPPDLVDGIGSAARFYFPTGLTVNGAGNVVYVADSSNNKIRKITIDINGVGTVTTVAGAAVFNHPSSVVVDGAGNLFVADTGNNTIRKVTPPGGTVTTLAGQAGSAGSADGDGTTVARFSAPTGVGIDSAGNVYVSDATNDTIRKITIVGGVGTVTTLAGTAIYQSADGTGVAARFTFPFGVVVDGSESLYHVHVADAGNNTIRKITVDNGAVTVVTLAGSAGPLGAGSADGAGTTVARFNTPEGVAVDGSGSHYHVYVADAANNTIRKITVDNDVGTVTTLAGQAGSTGSADGDGTTVARFNSPSGVAVDGSGNVYVADAGNNLIRKITIDSNGVGTVTTLAGSTNLTPPLWADGDGKTAARFNSPSGVAVDGSGNVYVADAGNNTIRKITIVSGVGTVTTLAGLAGTGNAGSTDGTGSAARFNSPSGVAVDGSGNVYVADVGNNTIRKISPAGVVKTLAGAPDVGSVDDTGSAARFDHPSGVAVDASGKLYVADLFNNTIRKGMEVPPKTHDFNGDTRVDLILEDTLNGDRGFWLMNGGTVASGGWVYLSTVAPEWRIAASADFNNDGQSDILWENTATGDRGFWLMNGMVASSWVELGGVATQWRIAAVADFNGDGQPDILWENTVTGDRGFWLMNGTTASSWLYLSTVAPEWRIAATADFNGDGKPDILWENTVTGERGFWLMNGTAVSSWVYLADVSTQWRIAAVADFNRDGQPDILWENTVTGDRGFWLMNGMVASSWVELGGVATEWRITP